MILKSKYGWGHEDMVKYIYKELKDEKIVSSIEDCIQASDKMILEILTDIRMTKSFRGFKNSNEHIKTIKEEAATHTAKLAEKYGLELNTIVQEENITPQSKIRKLNTRYIVAMAATLLIIVVAAIVLLRPPNNTLTAFVDSELQTNELPTLPSNYETVLSSDEPKELAELYKNRDYDNAISVIKEEIAKTENQDLTFFLGVCYLRNGKSKRAIKYLEPIAQGASAYKDDAKIELAYAYIKVGEYQKAYNLATDLKANGSEFYQDEADILLQKIVDFKPEINQN